MHRPRRRVRPAPAVALWCLLGPLCGVGLPASLSAATPGAQLVAPCAACHRLDGPDRDMSSIVGMPEDRLAHTMLAYRSGVLTGQIMNVVAAALSPAQIAAIAHYLAQAQAQAPAGRP